MEGNGGDGEEEEENKKQILTARRIEVKTNKRLERTTRRVDSCACVSWTVFKPCWCRFA